MFYWKWLLGKYFSKNDLQENILRKKKKREIKIHKMFFPFQIRKTFYRKMTLFSVDQENIFNWPLIFRETNTRKYWKYFLVSHFQWNKQKLIVSSLSKIPRISESSISNMVPADSSVLTFPFLETSMPSGHILDLKI